jgi:hypothetical protein
MTVIVKLVDGNTDIFETEKYLVTTKKEEMSPFIMDIKVFNGKHLLFKWRRPNQAHYKKHFVPPKVELTPEQQQERAIQTQLQ